MSNYYSGSATSFTDLKTAIITAATDNGWSNNLDELSKDGAYVLITSSTGSTGHLGALGRTAAGTNPSPTEPRIRNVKINNVTELPMPCDYEIFAFDYEIYMVVNYEIDKYQFLAFGKSALSLPGSGTWVAGSRSEVNANALAQTENVISVEFGGGAPVVSGSGRVVPGLGPFHNTYDNTICQNFWVNHGFDSTNWFWQSSGGSNISIPVSAQLMIPLFGVAPSTYNSENFLIPIKAAVTRASNLNSLALDLEHARKCRIDYLAPGEIITIGSDSWKTFPFYKKNTTTRNGSENTGTAVDHSGTLGWAIRYVPD